MCHWHNNVGETIMANRPFSKQLLTIPDIADRDQVSEKTVRRWIKNSELIAHKLGGQYRISEEDHDQFLRVRRGL
jgi:excisionase family DNA binding protein